MFAETVLRETVKDLTNNVTMAEALDNLELFGKGEEAQELGAELKRKAACIKPAFKYLQAYSGFVSTPGATNADKASSEED